MTASEEGMTADAIFEGWLTQFGRAMESGDVPALMSGFDSDSYWKDILSFTWAHPTFAGRQQITEAFAATLEAVRPSAVRSSPRRMRPRFARRTGKAVVEGFFDFDTAVGRGAGFVRLLRDEAAPLRPTVWLLLTTLQEIRGHEERIGLRRPTGNEFSRNTAPGNWKSIRKAELAYSDRDPEVLIIGAGHAGLILAARLKQIGVDALVVEKSARIGDVWRGRYDSLTLHNEIFANHMPYMPFPDMWHTWLPKDKLAHWLEAYAEALELNVWTGCEVVNSSFDDTSKIWSTRLRFAGGGERTIRTAHLVAAMGVSGGAPNMPHLPGEEAYRGEIVHSGKFNSGAAYAGKRAVVFGTGNSGHDIAQDLYVGGAAKVTLVQRSPTCVVSLEPTATRIYSIYSQGASVEDIDLLTAAIPYPILHQTYVRMTARGREQDRDMIQSLREVGYETAYGSDDTGFHMMYLRGEGGYYIDVGCCELIAKRKIDLIKFRDIDRLVADGVRMKDGSVVPCDLIVMATGFANMQEPIRRIVGDRIADRIGPVWGFDEDMQMRNMWRRTPQENFWVMGGALIDARLFSRFLALEIKASLLGILPARKSWGKTAVAA